MEDSSLNFWAMILASLLSGIIGVVISTIYYRRHEARKIKLDTLTRVIANRYDLKGDEFSRALNEIFVIFQKSNPVMKALSYFHEKTTTPGVSNEDALLRLIKQCVTMFQYRTMGLMILFSLNLLIQEQVAKSIGNKNI